MARKFYDSESGEVEEYGGEKNGRPAPEPTWMLVQAFCDTYQPCDNEVAADEVLTIAMLRDYFKCYAILDPRWIDVFPKYLDALAENGFRMQTSFAGEPAMFVFRKSGCFEPDWEAYEIDG